MIFSRLLDPGLRRDDEKCIPQGFLKSVSCLLITALLGIHSPAAWAEIYDINDLQQPDKSSAAMAGFYTVTPDGETTLEDPVESGFAITAGSDFDPERSQEEEPVPESSEQQNEKASSSKKKKRTIRIRVNRKPPQRDLASQFQCERHGLYYTNDGRCIVPAYQHYLPAIPRPMPGGGMHPGMPD
jgi:hypothetical protein